MLFVLMCRVSSWICLLLSVLAFAPDALAHPMPDIPVRASFERGGLVEILVEVDPRCFEADPNKAPYLVQEQWLKMTEEQRTTLLERTRDFIKRSVALHFSGTDDLAEAVVPQFDYTFTTMENQPLTKADDPVMVTGKWRGSLPPIMKEYWVKALPEGTFSVLFLNTMLGEKVERFQVLFPGEESYKLSLRPVWKQTSGVTTFSNGFKRFLFAGFFFVWSRGLEHLLFVVCLCLINGDRRDWLAQIKVYGVIHLLLVPWLMLAIPPFTGLASAASLVIMALINFWQRPLAAWRLALVGVFAAVHGLGFAQHYRSLEPVRDGLWAAGPGYLIGISAAQLMAVIMLAGIAKPLTHPVAYRKLVTNPFAMLIAGVGVWLFMHRLRG